MSEVKVGVITVSDSCARGEAEDKSGPYLATNIASVFDSSVRLDIRKIIIPDDIDQVETTLRSWSKELNLIITTGGTGFSPRDHTPEATRKVITREAAGLSQLMLIKSLQVTPLAALSRSVCGIAENCLIINLPGSTKACKECLEFLKPVLSHAVHLLMDETKSVKITHQALQSGIPQSQHTGHQCPLHSPAGISTGVEKDPEIVARRHRHSPWPLISVEEAQNIVMTHCTRAETEKINFRSACGRILSDDTRSPEPHPPFPASIKDGYAVIAADGVGVRKVIDKAHAGDDPTARVSSGECVRITTGAAVPPGADAIIQVEDTRVISASDDGRVEYTVEMLTAPKSGLDIRAIGSDIQQGQLVLKSGTKLKAAEMGVLASLGITEVRVYKQPVVGVISTGNELVEAESDITGGKIRDSNRITLITLLKEYNYSNIVDLKIAPDSIAELESTLKSAFDQCDVIITTGGVSMGEKDLVKVVIQENFKGSIHFGRVFMKPGKPTTFATLKHNDKKIIFFGLPGNPVSATVTSHLYVLPALRHISGNPNIHPTEINVMTTADIRLDPRPEYQRAVLNTESTNQIPTCQITGNQISSRLVSVCGAEVLVKLPPRTKEREVLPKGSVVRAIFL